MPADVGIIVAVRRNVVVDPIALPDSMLVELALQYLPRDRVERLYYDVTTKLAGAYNLYALPETWVTAPSSIDPIRGANPPCGNGATTLDEEVRAAAAAVELVGATADALGAGGIGTIIAGVINIFIVGNNTYRKDCVCRDLVVLIPGALDPQWVKEHVHLSYTLRDWEGERAVAPGQLPWAYIEGLIVSDDKPHVNVRTRRPDNEVHDCTMTFMCGRLKNWSHNHDRSVKVTALVDDFPQGIKGCTDFSIINRALYDHDIALCIDVETKQQLIKIYLEGVLEGSK